MWNQSQVFFSGYVTIPDVTLQSAILGFTNTSTEHLLLITHFLLINKCYLYEPRDTKFKFFFLAFKNNIKSEAPGERISEERKSLKK